MKHLLTFHQFLTEAEAPKPPAKTTPAPVEDETETPVPPATETPTSSDSESGVESGSAPESTPGQDLTPPVDVTATDTATSPAPGTGTDTLGSTPDLGGVPPASGASGLGGGASSSIPSPSGGGGSSLGGAPTFGEEETGEASPQQQETTEEPKKPEDYVAPINNFSLVLLNKGLGWDQEYPNGGGIKEMEGIEVSWKDLNKWIDENGFGKEKQNIAEYLMGETTTLDSKIKDKLKKAFSDESLGNKKGDVEVEYDEDLEPYVQDINTILVDL